MRLMKDNFFCLCHINYAFVVQSPSTRFLKLIQYLHICLLCDHWTCIIGILYNVIALVWRSQRWAPTTNKVVSFYCNNNLIVLPFLFAAKWAVKIVGQLCATHKNTLWTTLAQKMMNLLRSINRCTWHHGTQGTIKIIMWQYRCRRFLQQH